MAPPNAIRIMTHHGVGHADFRALGTGAVVLTANPYRIAAATLEVRKELMAIDAACSRFRPDSEIEIANRAGGHMIAVSPLLSEAVATALRAARITDGDVDPTVGETMEIIGYDRDFADITSNPEPVVRLKPVRGWTSVKFNEWWGTLQMPAGIKLDLGATAKALAADRAAARAEAEVGCGVLVSLGGDIATEGEPPAGGWHVRIADWHGSGPADAHQTVCIQSGGLATSSTTVRRWEKGGETMHHIVDPATGRPAEEVWRTVSVLAANCVEANIASTASIIRGDRAPGWLSSMDLSARLVRADGAVTMVGGWPAEPLAA